MKVANGCHISALFLGDCVNSLLANVPMVIFEEDQIFLAVDFLAADQIMKLIFKHASRSVLSVGGPGQPDAMASVVDGLKPHPTESLGRTLDGKLGC